MHSAHVSRYGQVPATIVPLAGAVADVHVLLVDDHGPLDVSEPNYDRVVLQDVRLEVDRLGNLSRVEAYVSKWGPLTIGGEPVPLGSRPQDELVRAVRTVLH